MSVPTARQILEYAQQRKAHQAVTAVLREFYDRRARAASEEFWKNVKQLVKGTA